MQRMTAEHFWQLVDKSGDCWIWTRYKDSDGYGRVGKKHVLAHRYAYQITNGLIPSGMEVCHSCDNPACVNPAHLWLGTHKENVHDSISKGRFFREEARKTKLTSNQVQEIRTRYDAGGISQSALAREYGASVSTIRFAVHRKTWKWL